MPSFYNFGRCLDATPSNATTISEYPFERADDALDDLRHGRFKGSAVLRVSV